MEKIVIVVDTNLWQDAEKIFSLLKEKTGKEYSDLWKQFDTSSFSEQEKTKFKEGINFINRLSDLKNHPGNKIIEIHVPSFVYNEKAYGTSSKITSTSKGSEGENKIKFDHFLESMPKELKKVVQKNRLNAGTDYPPKPPKPDESPKPDEPPKPDEGPKPDKRPKPIDIMKQFLTDQRRVDENLERLLKHLADSIEENRPATQKRTNELKAGITDIYDKYDNWDKPMTDVLKDKPYEITYDTKAKYLSSIYGKIIEYPAADENLFRSGPVGVLADRLTMKREEFDFFDLKIYLYARENNGIILTRNSQAFQEVNDPRFLGYFKDIKILHPLINYDSIEDLENPGDLTKIMEKSIERDFNNDVRIFRRVDEKLGKSILGGPVEGIINKIKYNYITTQDNLKNILKDVPLSEALKLFKFEDQKIKLSKKQVFSELSSPLKIKALGLVDKEFFQEKLSVSDFIIDSEIQSRFGLTQALNVPGIHERLREFLKNEGTNLEEFLNKKVFNSSDQKIIKAYFAALFTESHFKMEEIKPLINSVPPAEEPPIPVEKCPARPGGKKREASKCLLTWEDVERIQEEEEVERDPKKMSINSERFLEYLDTINDPQQRIQLIQFADQVINSAVNDEKKVSGSKEAELNHLINNHKVIEHFGKVGGVSGALNYGMAAKNILGDLMTGNIKGVAMNIGFLSTAGGLSELADISLARGAKYLESGKLVLGNTLKFASPFIGRLLSPLIVFDLYRQVKALNKDNKDAIVNIVGDVIYLGIDAIEIGVGIFEAVGAISGISAVTGPIGLAIGAVVFIGTDIYFAVRTVDKIDNIIHLTTGERWKVGSMSFFHLGIPHDIQDLVNIKSANNKLVQQGLNFLKQNDQIQRYVLPSAILNSSSQVELARDSSVIPEEPSIKWHRARPDDPEGGRIFCAPQGDWEDPPSGTIFKCENAIGIEDLGTKSNNYTMYNLGDGTDTIFGFAFSPNIFRIGAGRKSIQGGKKDDVFLIDSGLTVSSFPIPHLMDGKEGNNTLDLGGIVGDQVNVYFDDRRSRPRVYVRQDDKYGEIYFVNINRIIGRKDKKDDIYPSCTTKFINGQGGNPQSPDLVVISDQDCNHNKIVYLGPNTKLQNSATSGKFSYFINDVHSNINCSLISPALDEMNQPEAENLPNLTATEKEWPQQRFFLNATLDDIQEIEFRHEKENYYDLDVYLYFTNEEGISHRFVLDIVLGNEENISGRLDKTFIFLKDHTELRLHNDGLIGLLKTDKPVPDVIEKYRHVGSKLGISLFILNESEGTTVSIGSDRKDDILYNDPRHNSYLIGNKGNNVYMVASGRDTLTDLEAAQLPDITIYISDGFNHTNIIDLRSLSNQIKNDLRWAELRIQHFFESEDLVIDVTGVQSTLESGVLRPCCYSAFTSIRIKNTPKVTDWDNWCKKMQVIMNNAPVVLNCSASYRNEFSRNPGIGDKLQTYAPIKYNPSNYYTPLPLVFSGYDVIAITKNDLEPDTEVIVHQKLGKYRFLRFKGDLILTNGFDFEVAVFRPCTIIFKDFYNDFNVFYTIFIKYSDKMISLKEERRSIESAKFLEHWFEKYNDIANNISNPMTNKVRDKRNVNIFKERFPIQSDSQEHKEWISGDGMKTSSNLFGIGMFGSAVNSLIHFWSEPLGHIRDYLGSFVTPIPMNPSSIVNHQNEHQFPNRQRIDSKPNVNMSPNNNYSSVDVNSTLLLLDVLLRKLNDSKYKLPAEDNLLSPQEKLERKMAALTTKLELDPNDVVGSLEEQHRKLLRNLGDF